MFILIGYIVVTGCVLGGYALAGGHISALMQPLELLIIGGAAVGAFIVGNDLKTIKSTLKSIPQAFKSSKFTQALYLELLALLFQLLNKARKEGLMSIEADVEDPENSPIFSQFPLVSAQHHLIEFITDYLRLMVGGNLNALEIENLMDNEIETHHHEIEGASHAVTKIADGLPAFGIVAAVLGVVHTMASVGQPPAILGGMIAHALVGTFLGILMAYGYVGPLGQLMSQQNAEATKALECIKICLLASINGYSPAVAVEFARKVLYSTERPSFKELEDLIKQQKSKTT